MLIRGKKLCQDTTESRTSGHLSTLAALLAAGIALSGAAGCSQVRPYLETKQILTGKDDKGKEIETAEDAKGRSIRVPLAGEANENRPKPADKKLDYRVAIAPVQTHSIGQTLPATEGDTEQRPGAAPAGPQTTAAPGWGGSSGAGAARAPGGAAGRGGAAALAATGIPARAIAAKQVAFRYRSAESGSWVALCYRTPLFRELLFSPQDTVPPPDPRGDALPGTPEVAGGAQPGDAIEWLCPRCQATVDEAQGSCHSCGLAFAPEKPGPPLPGAEAPEALAGAEPAATEEGAVTIAVRELCFQCGRPVPDTAARCIYEDCLVVYQKAEALPPGMEGEVEGGIRRARILGPKPPETLVESANGRIATIFPNPEELQKKIIDTIDGYGLFREVKALNVKATETRFESLRDQAERGDEARGFEGEGRGFDYLIIPKVTRWELTYQETTGFKYAAAVAMWVAIGEPANLTGFPTAFIAGHRISADVEMLFELYHVRTGQKIEAPWQTRHRGNVTFDCDEWDHGYYPWSIIGVPLAGKIFDGGWRKLESSLTPHCLNQIQKSLIEEAVYPAFKKVEPKEYEVTEDEKLKTSRHQVALLIGVDQYEDRSIIPPQKVAEDMKAMQEALRKVGLHDASTLPSGSRYITFAGPVATKKNVLTWLAQEMPRLNPNDFVMIYYSGQGTTIYNERSFADKQEKYLMLYDTQVKDPAGKKSQEEAIADTALNVNDIARFLRIANVKNAIVAVDASFAAPAIEERLGRGRTFLPLTHLRTPEGKSLRDQPLEALTRLRSTEQFPFLKSIFGLVNRTGGKNGLVLLACDQDQAAMEYDNLGLLGMGLFTHYLAEALRGENGADRDDDGRIEPFEIVEHVTNNVRRHANVLYGLPQEVRVNGAQNMEVFFHYRAKRAGATGKGG